MGGVPNFLPANSGIFTSAQTSVPQLTAGNASLTAQPNTILPTDATHGRKTTITKQRQADLGAMFARDPRFVFIGKWLPFASNAMASPFSPVALVTHDGTAQQSAAVVKVSASEPAFMPTRDASYLQKNDDHLLLSDGAVLVRAGKRPVFVSTSLGGQEVLTRIAGGSLVLVSAFDGKSTILNLTDKSLDDVSVTLPTDQRGTLHAIHPKAGQIAEAYKLDSQPTSNLVATRIDVNQRLSDQYGLLMCQCHYLRALRKFNLMAALPKTDMQRVLKTAAAVGYACH
jgi:hypothetical protein